MYHSLLSNARFHNSLFDFDRLIAEQVRQSKCPFCQGNLNQSNFPRKPRGIPQGTVPDYPIRFSLCCATEGCRKRITPPSMRFLSRKVYCSVVVILIFLLKPASDESCIDRLNRLLGTRLSVETIRRWRRYWIKEVPQSKTWKRSALCSEFSQTLPVSLLSQFAGSAQNQLKMALKRLLPLSAGIHLFDVPFLMIGEG